MTNPSNDQIADVLDRVAELLEQQDENPFRIGGYRRAAAEIRRAEQSLAEVLESQGEDALKNMRGIGKKLAGTIRVFVQTGRLELLERLESETTPAKLFARVPGVGTELAGRIVSEVEIHTLEHRDVLPASRWRGGPMHRHHRAKGCIGKQRSRAQTGERMPRVLLFRELRPGEPKPCQICRMWKPLSDTSMPPPWVNKSRGCAWKMTRSSQSLAPAAYNTN